MVVLLTAVQQLSVTALPGVLVNPQPVEQESVCGLCMCVCEAACGVSVRVCVSVMCVRTAAGVEGVVFVQGPAPQVGGQELIPLQHHHPPLP